MLITPQFPELTSTRVRRTRPEYLSLPSGSLFLTHCHLCKQFSHLAAKSQARFLLWLLLSRLLSYAPPIILAPIRAHTSFPLLSLAPRHQISAPMTRTLFLVNSFPGSTCLPPFLASINQLLNSAYLLRYLMHSQVICDTHSFHHLVSKYILNAHHVPGTIPNIGDIL